MLDIDLAELYEVEVRVLNQAVKRNIKRFPTDFMFRLTLEEWERMSSQFVMTSVSKRPKVALPYAFTEQGLAMLSGVLNSEKAINVNIAIMRTFVLMRQYMLSYKDLSDKLDEFEKLYNKKFKDIYEAINYLLSKDNEDKPRESNEIGFKINRKGNI